MDKHNKILFVFYWVLNEYTFKKQPKSMTMCIWITYVPHFDRIFQLSIILQETQVMAIVANLSTFNSIIPNKNINLLVHTFVTNFPNISSSDGMHNIASSLYYFVFSPLTYYACYFWQIYHKNHTSTMHKLGHLPVLFSL